MSVFVDRKGPEWQTFKFSSTEKSHPGYLYVHTSPSGQLRCEARTIWQAESFNSFEEAVAWIECIVIAKTRRGER